MTPKQVVLPQEEEVIKTVNNKGLRAAAKDFKVHHTTLWRWLKSNGYVLVQRPQYAKKEAATPKQTM